MLYCCLDNIKFTGN